MPKKRIYTQEEINNVISLYNSGNKINDIYKQINIVPQSIAKILKDNNIKIRKSVEYLNRKSKKIIFTNSETQDIINMYNEWNSCETIALKYKVSSATINRLLKDNNIFIRDKNTRNDNSGYINKIYYYNDDYFEIIDSEDKAYWLGFLFADGCVDIKYNKNGNTKGGRVEITLKSDDEYMLYNFAQALNGNIPITPRQVKLNGKIFNAIRINIHSIKMCNDLCKLGCVPRKSLILEPPKNVPDEFINSFIRGYFDGDGHVGYYPDSTSPNINVSFSGNKIFLEWVKNILTINNINSNNIVKDKRHNVYELRISNRKNIAKFYDFLYLNCHYIMDRKKDKFELALKDFNIPHNRGWISNHADKLI